MFLSISFSFPTPLSKNKNKNAYLSDAKLSDLTPQPTPEGPWLCVHNCTQIPAWVGDGGGGGVPAARCKEVEFREGTFVFES